MYILLLGATKPNPHNGRIDSLIRRHHPNIQRFKRGSHLIEDVKYRYDTGLYDLNMTTQSKVPCKVCGGVTKKRPYKITGNDGIARAVYLCTVCPRATLIDP